MNTVENNEYNEFDEETKKRIEKMRKRTDCRKPTIIVIEEDNTENSDEHIS